jgi:hypothetical protein
MVPFEMLNREKKSGFRNDTTTLSTADVLPTARDPLRAVACLVKYRVGGLS